MDLKYLKHINMQRALRASIAKEVHYLSNFTSSNDAVEVYKRTRKNYLTPQSIVVTEKLEKQRSDGDLNGSGKRKGYLSSVLMHSRNFYEMHSQRSQIKKKLNRQIIKYYINKEKREQMLREKAERDRINALKRNDEAEYLKLVEQAKNKRLLLLLEQTDAYLKQIGEKVEEQQLASGDPFLKTSEDVKPIVVDDDEKKISDQKKSYYTRIHKVIEEIKEQPTVLVGGKLKEYQMDGLTWMVSLFNNKLNGILADEMGLGKTIQTIALISHLIEKKNHKGPFLIVVPLSTISNWSLEFKKWAPVVAAKMVVYKGVPNVRKKIYQQKMAHGNFFVCLTTFEYILKDRSSLSKAKWTYIIVDEGHRMKNHNSKLSTVLTKYYDSQYRIILTGTPLQNSLPELWSLLNFLLPSIFNSVENFEQWFNKPFAHTGEKVEMNEEETLLVINRLHKVLRPFLLRRMKSQVESQLPEKSEKVIKCEMSCYQKKMYESMTKGGVMTLKSDDGQLTQKGLMNTLMQLRKICNHPYIFNQQGWNIDENLYRASGKLELLDRILPKLKKAGHRVLIFTQMTSVLDIFEDYFAYKAYQFLRLDGSTKSEDRELLLQKFNQPNSPYFVFVLSTRAGGLGLNLQTADTVILFDSDWNPQMDLQAQDRAHRIGQKNKVLVLRLITVNSIEEKILERANFKLDLDSKIIEAGMFNKNSNADDRKKFLLSLLKEGEEEDDEDDIPSYKQVNQMIARSDEEYVLFQQMDREYFENEKIECEKNGTEPKQRLIQEHELPPWLLVDFDEQKALDNNLNEEYGRGRRKRNDVVYTEDLKDDFLDDEEEQTPRRRKTKKVKTDEYVDYEEEDDS